jgi:arsenate reductase-like glutaredoxin family protein
MSAEALQLLEQVDTLIAAKGKTLTSFDIRVDQPSQQVLLEHLLGPTGNMRSPTVLVGKTLLVGFQAETYDKIILQSD